MEVDDSTLADEDDDVKLAQETRFPTHLAPPHVVDSMRSLFERGLPDTSPDTWPNLADVANLVIACDFCNNMPGLVSASRYIADRIASATSDEIAHAFRVTCDMTVRERASARRDHCWHLSPNAPIGEVERLITTVPDLGRVDESCDGELVLELVVSSIVLERSVASSIAQCSRTLLRTVSDWSTCRSAKYAEHVRSPRSRSWPEHIAPVPRAGAVKAPRWYGGLSWIDFGVMRSLGAGSACSLEAVNTILALKYPRAYVPAAAEPKHVANKRSARFQREVRSEKWRLQCAAPDRAWRIAAEEFVERGSHGRAEVFEACQDWVSYLSLDPVDRRVVRGFRGRRDRRHRVRDPISSNSASSPTSLFLDGRQCNRGRERCRRERRSDDHERPMRTTSEIGFIPPSASHISRILSTYHKKDRTATTIARAAETPNTI